MAMDKHGGKWRVRVTHMGTNYKRLFDTEGGARECNDAIARGRTHPEQMDGVIWHYFSAPALLHHRMIKMAEEIDGMIAQLGRFLNDYDPDPDSMRRR